MSDVPSGHSGVEKDLRVRFAAERTLLAWIRTGVAMMGFGFVIARFGWFLRELSLREQHPNQSTGWSVSLGITLISLGIFVNIISSIEHLRFLRRFDRGLPYVPTAWSLGVIVAMVLSILGIVMSWYLFTLS